LKAIGEHRELFSALATEQNIARRTRALFAIIKRVKLGELGIEWHAALVEKWREAGDHRARTGETRDAWRSAIIRPDSMKRNPVKRLAPFRGGPAAVTGDECRTMPLHGETDLAGRRGNSADPEARRRIG